MPSRTPGSYRITNRDQIDALASPVRLEIVDGVRLAGPCSIAELGRLLGRPADGLYYHMRVLVRVGLLVPCGARETTRRDEILYRTPARRIRTPLEQSTAAKRSGVVRIFSALLRLTDRDFRSAALGKRRCRGIRSARIKGWLTADELREVQQHVDAIIDVFHRDRDEPARRRRLYAATTFLVPLEPNTRTR